MSSQCTDANKGPAEHSGNHAGSGCDNLTPQVLVPDIGKTRNPASLSIVKMLFLLIKRYLKVAKDCLLSFTNCLKPTKILVLV